MKNLPLKNPFFYATLVLAGLLVFELSGIVAAQYAAPTAAPVGGTPAAPLHAGSATQTKTGILNVKGAGSGVSLNPNGLFYFLNSAGTPVAGFRYNGTSVQYSNNGSSWQNIGTGTGGGANYWTPGGSGIYTSYNVGIGVTSPSVNLEVGGVAQISKSTTRSARAYIPQNATTTLPRPAVRMTCDADNTVRDCESAYYETSEPLGTRRYDYYEVGGSVNPAASLRQVAVGEVQWVVPFVVQNIEIPTGASTPTILFQGANGNITLFEGYLRGTPTHAPFITGYVQGAVGNTTNDDHVVGALPATPAGLGGDRCVVFLQAYGDENCDWGQGDFRSCKVSVPFSGTLAACWLGGAGDRNVYGSYSGDDNGNVDGTLRCGYLCW